MNILTTLHRPFHLTLVDEPQDHSERIVTHSFYIAQDQI